MINITKTFLTLVLTLPAAAGEFGLQGMTLAAVQAGQAPVAAPVPLPAGLKPFACDARLNSYQTGKFHVRFDKGRAIFDVRGHYGAGPDISALGRSRFLNSPQSVRVSLDASGCEVDPNEPRRIRCQGAADVRLIGWPKMGNRRVDGMRALVILEDDHGLDGWFSQLTLVDTNGRFFVEKAFYPHGVCVLR